MRLIRTRRRRLMVAAGTGALALIVGGWQFAAQASADGSDVARKLGDASTTVGRLSGSVGQGGAYGNQANAGSVPFLGSAPASLLPGVFDALGPLSGFNDFSPGGDDDISVVKDKVQSVDKALASGELTDRVYTCGAAACTDESKVKDLTAIEVRLAARQTDPVSGDIDFTSLGLPSMGFLPNDAKQLDVDLSWSLNVRLIADASGLRLAPVAHAHELTLGASISLPTDGFTVDLGALLVRATTSTKPTFNGTLLVDLSDNGALTFGFGDGSGFKARWHLETENSPLMGVSGDLDIAWPLSGPGVNSSDLTIKVENVTIDTSKFVGEDIQAAAAAIRDVTHPIRTAVSPLLEPIPGLTDLSAVLGGDEVTMLRLMERAGFSEDLRDSLEKLRLVDDTAAALAGGAGVNLGSFTLVGGDALKPVDQALSDAAVQTLKNIVDECSVCKETVEELLTAVNGGTTPGEGGFQFDLPVLRDPASLAGLLLGRDVELITFDTDRLGYDEDLDISLARFFIFSVKISGPLEATIHLKGGVDTQGIRDALRSGDTADVLNGVYLQNPGGGPVVKLLSEVELDLSAEIVEIGGGPHLDVSLAVPPSAPGGKLRPALAAADDDGIGCALLEADDARADFGVRVTATFDYLLDSHTEILAEHTFLTKQDLCEPAADDVPVAEPDGNGNVIINTATARGIPAGEPDTIKVFTRHDPSDGSPKEIVVTGNNNQRSEFPAADVINVRYDSGSDPRPVIFRAVKTDGKAFEKNVFVETGDGEDDVLVDSDSFGWLRVNGGDDKVIANAGGSLISGGAGDDYVAGGPNVDILEGGDGDDTIDGAGGFDILSGGNHDDLLLDSSPDSNCLSGNEGNDVLISGPGADYLNGDEAICGDADRDPEDAGATDPLSSNDVIVTGGGADVVVAGNGNDEVRLDSGGMVDPDDPAWDAGVTVHGNGGDDTITTGNGDDYVHGGPGDDEIHADGGPRDAFALRNGGMDTIYGGLGEDTIYAGDRNDTIYGDNGTDTCTPPIAGQPPETDTAGAADEVYGGADADHIALEAGNDTAYGEGGDDVICGHAGSDDIDGGDGDDTVFGGTGNDTVKGGPDADELFGNDGADTMNGDDGDDRIVGGSSKAATPDTGDTINGGDGVDIVVGDNGIISADTPPVPSVFDLFANDATLGGDDTIQGGAGDDRAFGGIGGDTIRGGDGDDHLEGNNGDDAIYGEGGEDDIIGGTSPESLPDAAPGRTASDAPDDGETILSGGDAPDVILGDNGIIARPGGVDPITGGVARTVTLLDRDRTGAALAAVSGGDYIEGNGGNDRLYGEGGADYIKGNDGDDYVEGNQDADRLEGNSGEDDLIGGSSFSSAPGAGDPDSGDQIAGGGGADVIIGDNAVITRATTGSGAGFDWDTVANSWLGPTARRSITLLEKATLTPANFGNDVVSGGSGEDLIFGQDGDDGIYGGSEDDYMEGNGGNDVLFGDQVAPPTGDAHESAAPELDGVPGPDGQDDQIGGSSWVKSTTPSGAITGQRDGDDELHGDGNADVQLGDNGTVLRRIVNGAYQTYQATTGKPTIVRQAAPSSSPPTALPARFDVGATAGARVWGNDTLYGDDGDDLQLAGDGNDTLYGGAGDDDMYGELGDDRMSGEAGEDAMLGDRGVITNRLVSTPGATFSVTSPPKISFTPFAAHPLDRRVDMNDDGDGAPLQSPGMTTGGADFMRGGPDHDSMHGGTGNDLMNGDSGGDYLFGADGADAMWGGKGRECADPLDLACHSDRGPKDVYVDYLFGGRGLMTDSVTGGADILDYRPRPGLDPASWFEITSTRADDRVADHQHHQGIDWIYGGWDRDVMQADIADNGPNEGDRLIDWTGAYNLYTHCPAAYGGYNDIRVLSPSMVGFLEQLAHALGAGESLADIRTKGTGGYNELALVYKADVKHNSGSAYPETPGHFDEFSCVP